MASAMQKLRLYEQLREAAKLDVLQNDIEQGEFEEIVRDVIEEKADDYGFWSEEDKEMYINVKVDEIREEYNGNFAQWCLDNIEGFKIEHYIGEFIFDDAYERIKGKLQAVQDQEKPSVERLLKKGEERE